MIARFNRKQAILGFLGLVLSAIATLVTWAFFHFTAKLVIAAWKLDAPDWVPTLCGLAGLLVVFVSGILRWRSQLGHESYGESAFYMPIEHATGGAFFTDFYAQRVTAPAFALTQICLAAPLQLLKALARFRSLIAARHGLELRLESLLGEIRGADKWLPIQQYAGHFTEIAYLIRMGHLDFSAKKGIIRAASP